MSLKIGLFVATSLAGISLSHASCNLVFNNCPSNFTSATINVPNDVVWLDPVIPVCSEEVTVQTGTNTAPPSIVFVIDNSGSMGENCANKIDKVTDPQRKNQFSDPDVKRFTLLKNNLLDSIAKNTPNAEVGLVIFSRRLQFDDRDPGIFKPAFPGDPTQHDAYVPLTSMKQVFSNGKTGLDTLKSLLTFTGEGYLVNATNFPASRTNSTISADNIRSGTDITLGFETAKLALKSAKAAKGDQYIIFLSDGNPSSLDNGRTAFENDFQKGIETTTTFTIFFVPASEGNTNVPTTISKMTQAIKENGFSSSNPKSAYWGVNQGTELLTLINENILNPIFSSVPAKAASATLTVGTTTTPQQSVDANSFNFGKRVALTGDPTVVKLDYTYRYTDAGMVKSKLVSYTLNIKRTGASKLDSGLTQSCSETANISLYFNNTPIQIVTADHDSVGVHVTLASGACIGCTVQVATTPSPDKESVVLAPVGNAGVGTFKRKTSNTPVAGNGILENLPTDSIVITWINPENTLDIVRKAFPYSDISSGLTVKSHGEVAQPKAIPTLIVGKQFVLVAPPALTPNLESTPNNWTIKQDLPTGDSASFVGIELEMTRSFRATMSIFSNLGQFVNKIDFSLTQPEFEKLANGSKNHSKKLTLLWDNRAQDGSLAGTGAYLLKTDVTLLKVPGIAEDQVVQSDIRRVGLVRAH